MLTNNLKGKVVVIGAGNVGSTIAYTTVLNNVASEVVLIDVNREKAKGEALDMNHGIAYVKQIMIHDGDYSDCKDADVIIITAGLGRKPGQTRLDLAKINVNIAKDIAKNIMKYATNPILLVVSNPVDIITYVLTKETGLPPERVIGTGTTLDTSRFKYLISKHCNIDVRNVHASIIGEHGDSEVPVWSRANIAGKPFDDFLDNTTPESAQAQRNKIFEETKTAGAEIISLKGATFYAIAMGTVRILSAIIGNEQSVLTVSTVLNGEYGIKDIALSLPCVVNSSGISRKIDIQITEEEETLLLASAEQLKSVLKEVYEQ